MSILEGLFLGDHNDRSWLNFAPTNIPKRYFDFLGSLGANKLELILSMHESLVAWWSACLPIYGPL